MKINNLNLINFLIFRGEPVKLLEAGNGPKIVFESVQIANL